MLVYKIAERSLTLEMGKLQKMPDPVSFDQFKHPGDCPGIRNLNKNKRLLARNEITKNHLVFACRRVFKTEERTKGKKAKERAKGQKGSGLEISFFNQSLPEHLTDHCVMNFYLFSCLMPIEMVASGVSNMR